MFRLIQGLVSKHTEDKGQHLTLRINEAIQSVIIQGLHSFYDKAGVVFVGSSALRFCHRMERYIDENKIKFKVDNFDDIQFDDDMKSLQAKLSQLLNIDVDLLIEKEEKKRRLDNGFFIAFRRASLVINGVTFYLEMLNLPIGDVIRSIPYDEYKLGNVKEITFEDKKSSLALVTLQSIGDERFDARYIYDQTWCIKQGEKVDPEFFEALVNSAHMSMLEVRFENLLLTLKANSTRREYVAIQDAIITPTSNQATLSLQIKECSEIILGDINSLSQLFDMTFEEKRNKNLGYEITEGSSAIVDGKNVQGYGKFSMAALLNR